MELYFSYQVQQEQKRNTMDKQVFPGKFAATVTLGPKGQIVIPKGARDLFGYQPGDKLLLLADIDQGIAILPTTAIDSLLPNQPPTMEKK